jgi:glycosyltransferase involved in cell wall biosynthesis
LERNLQTLLPRPAYSFTGKLPYEQIPNLLMKNDVFLLVSDYEGLPLSLVEAMGCGLIPVVSDLPSGIRELVDDTTGKRVDPGNIAGYADAIAWLHQNRATMEQLSSNSCARVRREFSVEAMTDRWLAALPEKPESDVSWPSHWSIKPPVGAEQMFRFSWAGRLIRRMLFSINSLAGRQSCALT